MAARSPAKLDELLEVRKRLAESIVLSHGGSQSKPVGLFESRQGEQRRLVFPLYMAGCIKWIPKCCSMDSEHEIACIDRLSRRFRHAIPVYEIGLDVIGIKSEDLNFSPSANQVDCASVLRSFIAMAGFMRYTLHAAKKQARAKALHLFRRESS